MAITRATSTGWLQDDESVTLSRATTTGWSQLTSSGGGTPVSVNVTDVSTTSALGTVSVLGKSLTTLSNVVVTGYISSVTINGKALTNLTGVQATGVVTDVVIAGKSLVNLSGVVVSGYISSVSVISGTAAQVTGVLATGSVSTPTALGKAKVNPSAVLATSALGTVTIYEPPVPQSINGDPDFNYVSLLLPFNGSNGDTTFYDASRNITSVNNPGGLKVLSTAQSKFGSTSLYFPTNDNNTLYVSNTTIGDFGTSDFTVELWAYCLSTGGSYGLFSKTAYTVGSHYSLRLNTSTQKLSLYIGSTEYLFSSTVSLNAWNHIALVKNSGVYSLFVNGVKDASTFSNTTAIGAYVGWSFSIGTVLGLASSQFYGYIDSIRVSTGLARYTSNFLVPTSPFPTDWLDESDPYYDNVVLHLPMDGPENGTTFVDRSLNPKTVTTVGNTKLVAAQSKFGGRSVYFDGNGDYLSLAYADTLSFNSVDFTIEGWAYYDNAMGTYGTLIDFRGGGATNSGWVIFINKTDRTLNIYDGPSGNTVVYSAANTLPTINTWFHWAVVRSGTVVTLYIDGVTNGASSSIDYNPPVTTVNGIRIGINNLQSSGLVGYIDSLRITKGTARYTSNFTPPTGPFAIGKPYTVDPYASNVKLLLTGSGAHGSQVIEDKSSVGNTITVAGNTSVDRVRSKVYGGSIYFDGTGDTVYTGTTAFSASSSDNATWEAWIYKTNSTFGAVIGNDSSAPFLAVSTDNTLGTQFGSWYYSTGTITLNTWQHIALVKQGTSYTWYINGTNAGGFTNSDTISSTKLWVGSSSGHIYFTGYVTNTRVTSGVARYTANFTPGYSYLIPLNVTPTLIYVEGVGIVAYIGTLNLSAIVYPIGILTDAELGIGRVASWGNLGTSQIPNWVLVDDSNTSLWRLVDDSQTTDWQTIH